MSNSLSDWILCGPCELWKYTSVMWALKIYKGHASFVICKDMQKEEGVGGVNVKFGLGKSFRSCVQQLCALAPEYESSCSAFQCPKLVVACLSRGKHEPICDFATSSFTYHVASNQHKNQAWTLKVGWLGSNGHGGLKTDQTCLIKTSLPGSDQGVVYFGCWLVVVRILCLDYLVDERSLITYQWNQIKQRRRRVLDHRASCVRGGCYLVQVPVCVGGG